MQFEDFSITIEECEVGDIICVDPSSEKLYIRRGNKNILVNTTENEE